MKDPIRRIVTGHDESGKAVVVIDDTNPNLQEMSQFDIVRSLVWAADETPADLTRSEDPITGVAFFLNGIGPKPGGSNLVVIDFVPGVKKDAAQMMHRTRTLDYAIVLSGEIDMHLSDSTVHCKAGDVIIQQGTIHAWVNRSPAICRVAFVMIDAVEPAVWALSPG